MLAVWSPTRSSYLQLFPHGPPMAASRGLGPAVVTKSPSRGVVIARFIHHGIRSHVDRFVEIVGLAVRLSIRGFSHTSNYYVDWAGVPLFFAYGF